MWGQRELSGAAVEDDVMSIRKLESGLELLGVIDLGLQTSLQWHTESTAAPESSRWPHIAPSPQLTSRALGAQPRFRSVKCLDADDDVGQVLERDLGLNAFGVEVFGEQAADEAEQAGLVVSGSCR